ncbi:MAG: DnaD domain protein [Clostridiales bacterium]|nr:DnaD domain protein [Clostridiales bacterium]
MFKLSPEAALDGSVSVENKFIVEYLPYADGDYVKVYLYGLSLAARKADGDDTIERLCRRLDLDEATVNAAIDYWSDRGLMARLGDEVTYLSTRTARPKIKKYDVDKYAEFNRQAQLYISSRQILPAEYNEYYALMEKLELEWQAMTLIVKYCVDLKGENVSCPYILAVARNLAEDGYRTHDAVADRLEEFGVYYNDLCAVMSSLGGKRPDHEAVQLYKKWIKVYKFDKSVIAFVATTIKRGGAATLDYKLTAYRDAGLFTVEKITAYEEERKTLISLAKSVNKAIGAYYDNVEPEIAQYIKPWLDMGFEQGAILALAEYCMKNNLRLLADLDAVVRDCFAAGLTTESDVRRKVESENRYDGDISAVMKIAGIKGAVKNTYRALYANWTEKLKMEKAAIEYAAALSEGKDNPFAYVNRILAAWSEAGITTLETAKAEGTAKSEAAATAASKLRATVIERYTADELDEFVIHLTDED